MSIRARMLGGDGWWSRCWLVLGLLLTMVRGAEAGTIEVNTTDDELNRDGDCSLREALQAARSGQGQDQCPAGAGTNRIKLPAGRYPTSQLQVDFAIDIRAEAGVVLDGGDQNQVLQILPGGSVQMRGVAITGGNPSAIHNQGTLEIRDCRIHRNRADLGGAGIYAAVGSVTEVKDCTFEANVDGAAGGGAIYSAGTLAVRRSLFVGNDTQNIGSAIFVPSGNAVLETVTVSGELGDQAVAVGEGAGLKVSSSTFYGNHGIAIANNGGAVQIRSSIVAGRIDGDEDVRGAFNSLGNNLIGDEGSATGFDSGEIESVEVEELADNGGPTLTHALESGSEAVDQGSCEDTEGDKLHVDQRGLDRKMGASCDVGAFESQGNAWGMPSFGQWAMMAIGLLMVGIFAVAMRAQGVAGGSSVW